MGNGPLHGFSIGYNLRCRAAHLLNPIQIDYYFDDTPHSESPLIIERFRQYHRGFTHAAQHRGQLLAMLRQLGRDLHSTYGPTADTGGLMQNHAPTIYAYASVDALLEREAAGGAKAPLPGPSAQPVTERPAAR
jgi:hypothetical protein